LCKCKIVNIPCVRVFRAQIPNTYFKSKIATHGLSLIGMVVSSSLTYSHSITTWRFYKVGNVLSCMTTHTYHYDVEVAFVIPLCQGFMLKLCVALLALSFLFVCALSCLLMFCTLFNTLQCAFYLVWYHILSFYVWNFNQLQNLTIDCQ
jgi:hypothetical protein